MSEESFWEWLRKEAILYADTRRAVGEGPASLEATNGECENAVVSPAGDDLACQELQKSA